MRKCRAGSSPRHRTGRPIRSIRYHVRRAPLGRGSILVLAGTFIVVEDHYRAVQHGSCAGRSFRPTFGQIALSRGVPFGRITPKARIWAQAVPKRRSAPEALPEAYRYLALTPLSRYCVRSSRDNLRPQPRSLLRDAMRVTLPLAAVVLFTATSTGVRKSVQVNAPATRPVAHAIWDCRYGSPLHDVRCTFIGRANRP